MENLLQLTVNALALGSVYALVALAFILVSEATGVVNFATGQFVMAGCFFGVTTLINWGMPTWPGYAVALAMMLVFGIVFYLVVYRPLQDSSVVSVIIGTVAAGIVIQNLALLVWGSLAFRPVSPFGARRSASSGYVTSAVSVLRRDHDRC